MGFPNKNKPKLNSIQFPKSQFELEVFIIFRLSARTRNARRFALYSASLTSDGRRILTARFRPLTSTTGTFSSSQTLVSISFFDCVIVFGVKETFIGHLTVFSQL